MGGGVVTCSPAPLPPSPLPFSLPTTIVGRLIFYLWHNYFYLLMRTLNLLSRCVTQFIRVHFSSPEPE